MKWERKKTDSRDKRRRETKQSKRMAKKQVRVVS